jgi:hypothetical protein
MNTDFHDITAKPGPKLIGGRQLANSANSIPTTNRDGMSETTQVAINAWRQALNRAATIAAVELRAYPAVRNTVHCGAPPRPRWITPAIVDPGLRSRLLVLRSGLQDQEDAQDN